MPLLLLLPPAPALPRLALVSSTLVLLFPILVFAFAAAGAAVLDSATVLTELSFALRLYIFADESGARIWNPNNRRAMLVPLDAHQSSRAYGLTDCLSKEAAVLTSGATAVTCLLKVT